MLRGGGIGQPSDPPGSDYYKPILEHNGTLERLDRYCSDIYTDAALRFIEQSKDKPFFTYLAFNCPHLPLQAPEAETAVYTKLDLSPAAFPKVGQPVRGGMAPENLAKAYGMIANVDANLGRLFAKLDEWKLSDNTVVIFLTDNGPGPARWVAGLRAAKGSVYEGGIRVPFFIRWPAGRLSGGRKANPACAHIDVVPTLLAACGVAPPKDRTLDGTNLLPLLRGETKTQDLARWRRCRHQPYAAVPIPSTASTAVGSGTGWKRMITALPPVPPLVRIHSPAAKLLPGSMTLKLAAANPLDADIRAAVERTV
jgi:arylsulfatase A-like enzyme